MTGEDGRDQEKQ